MIGLHATSDSMGGAWADAAISERVGPTIIRTLLYVARTELFIIISAFLLVMSLDRRPRGYTNVVKDQFVRLSIPFGFWTLFYAVYGLVKATHLGYSDSVVAELMSPSSWIGFLLLGDVKYHMHFIPTLFGVLLFFPLFVASKNNPILGVCVIIGLAVKFEVDRVLYQSLWGTEALPYLVRTTKILSYVGYGMIAGSFFGLFSRIPFDELRKTAGPIAYVFALLLLLKFCGAYLTVKDGAYPFTYRPAYWADFLMPVFLFALCMSLHTSFVSRRISNISHLSLGLYLVHPIILDACEIYVTTLSSSPTIQVVMKILITIPSTFLLVLIIERSSLMSWTIGLRRSPKLHEASPSSV